MIMRFYLYDLTISQKRLRVVVSIPEVGSSSIIILESPIKDIPTESFLFCPPDSVLANWF